MTEMNVDSIRGAIADVADPETGRAIGTMGQLKDVSVNGSECVVTVGITSHSRPIADDLIAAVKSAATTASPGAKVTVNLVDHERPPARSGQIALRAKSVIAVGSGKGGVGKSTVAAALALSLRRFGSRVGLMDADVYGPSIPHLLGLEGRPAVTAAKRIEPIKLNDTMPVMSMGFLVEPDQAVIWRGPMLHGSINQFLGDTEWGELDYLIIDMPPGTGDVALTLSQALPLAGAVVVCTPQDVALLDAVKAISMFAKVNIPVLGMVENMSGFRCPDSDRVYDIFGRGGARAKADELNVPFLGELPIEISLRKAGDEGRLPELYETGDAALEPLDRVAQAVVRSLAQRSAASPPKGNLPTL